MPVFIALVQLGLLMLLDHFHGAGRAQLDSFRGIIFVGGFSYADVLDSAKGWAGTIRFNSRWVYAAP